MVTLSYCGKGSKKAFITLYDLSGHVVYEKTADMISGRLETRIDLKALAEGTYLMEMREGSSRIHKKLIKR